MERRIQITNVERIPLAVGARVLLGGWSEEEGVYAFWDARRHQGFSPGSPSLQISQETLQKANLYGFAGEARSVREGPEIAVGVQPDYLLWYLEEWERLYECGTDIEAATNLIETAVEEERAFVDSGENDQVRARRHRVVTVVHAFRDARFRPLVLRAYGYRCCITGLSLRLVDAAHIIPVTDPGSTDETWNGLALCANLHRAYDNGLLGILPGGHVALNETAQAHLRREHLASGIDEFKHGLQTRMRMPVSREHRPRDNALLAGLKLRGWTEADIRRAESA